MLCEYGCGQEAKYLFKNGKWCCSKHYNSCPSMRQKNKEANIKRSKYEKEHGIIRKHPGYKKILIYVNFVKKHLQKMVLLNIKINVI